MKCRTPAVALCAALMLPQAGPAQPLAGAALQARQLAATCASCHGTNGQPVGDMRPLAGLPAPQMLALLAAFREGTAPATVMHQIARGYTDEQLKLIAGYFAAQPPARSKARP